MTCGVEIERERKKKGNNGSSELFFSILGFV